MPRCRVILDAANYGAWNMAVDEALLGLSDPAGDWTLRFYAWREPTLTLGYFQPLAARAMHSYSATCPVVRRSTGGGAILHDRELTYSLVVPGGGSTDRRRGDGMLYEAVHASLIEALLDCGCPAAALYRDTRVATPLEGRAGSSELPFLCFQRRAGPDVVLAETKLAGSAQRRQRHALLQHGSVLLARSSAAPEVEGLLETTGRNISMEDLRGLWLARLAAKLNLSCCAGQLRDDEVRWAEECVQSRYGHPTWTARR